MSRHRRALIVGLTAVSALAGAGFAAVRHAGDDNSVRMLFTGDILLSRQVQVERQATGRSPWDSLSALFARADWVGGNLEGSIGPDSTCVARDHSLCFAFDEAAPALLATAGFNALTVENNHAADLGPAARDATVRALAGAGVMGVDFDRSPRFTRIGNLTVAIVAITTVPGDDGRAQTIPSVDVEQRLRLAHSLANLVVVSIHWGNELQDWPSVSQRAAAAWLVDHGADVVIGHHPHVVQRPDCVHGHPVFYSLGNHVFDQKYPETKEGLIADCRVRGGRVQCGGIRTHTRRGSAIPAISGASTDTALAGCSVGVHPSLVVSGWTLRPRPWSTSQTDSVGVSLEGWRNGALGWMTRRVDLVSIDTGLRADRSVPLLLALERHPSSMDGEIGIRPHVYEVGDRGLIAKWRGTALAWPLLDAVVDDDGDLCALHRGDSFLRPDPSIKTTRTMRYRWNGFGFSAAADPQGRCRASSWAE